MSVRDEAEQIVAFRPSPPLQRRIEVLAEKANEGALSSPEHAEYESYVRANSFISVLQARAPAIPLPNEVTLMQQPAIVSDPDVMMGKAVIAGARITVELILEKLASGESIEQLLEAHPQLTRERIFAALEYAGRVLRSDIVYPIATAAL